MRIFIISIFLGMASVAPSASPFEKVEGFSRGRAVIGGELYSPRELEAYYRKAGADEALQLQQQARRDKRAGLILPPVLLLSGIGLGLAAGMVAGPNDPNRTYKESLTTGYLQYWIEGALYGAAAGGIAALSSGIYKHLQYKKHRQAAADSFNQGLLNSLQFQIGPGLGGGMAALKLNF